MSQRPNILFLIADDHRASALGAAGDPTVQTPVLDALAARGVMFRRAHMMGGMCGAVCVPTRASLHTGVNPLQCSVGFRPDDCPGQMRLRIELPLLGETLRRAGYHTHLVGKWHNDPAALNRSFASGTKIFLGGMSDHYRVPVQAYDPSGRYPADQQSVATEHSSELFASAALEFLRDYREPRPFCLYVGFTAPHDPRTAPAAFASRYRPDAMPLPPNFLPRHPFDNGELDVRDERLAPWPRTPEAVRRHIADYYAMISHLDAQIGRVLEGLRARGGFDNTVVVYTSDHGLAVGQHGLMGKQNLYDHTVRVPLLIGGPDLPAGKRIESVVQSYSLFPTLCELCGVASPPTVESRSLVPWITGAAVPSEETVFALYTDCQRMVSDGQWKLIRYRHSVFTHRGTDRLQLFDLERDPWETTSLAGSAVHQAQRARLQAALADWERRVSGPAPQLVAGTVH